MHYIHKLVGHECIDNPDEKRCVDHINGDKKNNHCENLRFATHAENSMNRRNMFNTSSMYKGVSFHKPLQKWVVHIKVNGEVQHLGYFEDEREAAEAYNAAALEHFGEYAKLNEFEN